MSRRITCIERGHGHPARAYKAISRFGWVNPASATGKLHISDRDAMWNFLTKGGTAYVRDRLGNVAYAYPKKNRFGTRFVQTRADRTLSDNLRSLPEILTMTAVPAALKRSQT